VGLAFEIIVVDNSSEPDDVEMLEELIGTKDVRLIKSKINLGFGGGGLLGYQFSTGDYLAFINNDSLLNENSLLKLFAYIKTDENIGVLGLNQRGEGGECFEYSARQFIGLRHHLLGSKSSQKFYAKKYGIENLDQPFEVDMVSGAFMFFDAQKFAEVGGFDPKIFLFYEEMDICFRLKQKGYKTIFYPGASFIHYQGKSSGKIITKNELIISYLYVIQKNYAYWHYLVIKIVLLIKYGIKAILKPKKYWVPFFIILKGGNSLTYSAKP
tara:strand:+ start:2348 stop:3154 length:807 start_codon:yes stop_codon:yes gene_type:complete